MEGTDEQPGVNSPSAVAYPEETLEELDIEKEQRRERLEWVFYGVGAMLLVMWAFYVYMQQRVARVACLQPYRASKKSRTNDDPAALRVRVSHIHEVTPACPSAPRNLSPEADYATWTVSEIHSDGSRWSKKTRGH
jgi:hypothetical protein